MYPRRAHWPIVVPETPTRSPASPARKRPWGRSGGIGEGCAADAATARAAGASVADADQAVPVGLGHRRRLGGAQEVLDQGHEPDRLLAVREVPGAGEDLEAAPGDRGVRGLTVRGRDDRI